MSAANDNFSPASAVLHRGDCLDVMTAIPAQSVDLILCDLPYGTTACSWDSIIDLDGLWAQYKRVITPTGVIVLTAAQPFTTVLGASNLGWLKESLVWEKSRATGFLQSKKRHLKKHEDILVFSPGTVVSGKGHQTARNMTFNPQGLVELEKPVRSRNGNMKGGALKYSGGHNTLSPIYRPCYIKPNTKLNGEPAIFNGKPIRGDGRNQTHTNYPASILRFASERNTVHPTQKPVALMEYLIRTYSNDGDTVLDNSMGSGTTGVACANVGNRDFIGIERDARYFAIAETRIAAAQHRAPEPPPILVAANDDVPVVVAVEHDEAVARVPAIIDPQKLRVAAKAAAWKLRRGPERQARTRHKPRRAVRAEEDVATVVRAPARLERDQSVSAPGSSKSVTLHQGDCLQTMRGMADGSVDLIVTSPPYNLRNSTGSGFGYGMSGGKWKNAALKDGYASYSDDMSDDAYVEWMKSVISECWRLIPDDGAIFFNHKSRIQGGICLLPTRLLPPEVILRQEIIWARSGGMNFSRSFFLPTHERVLVLAKPKFRLKKGASSLGDVWSIPQERNNRHPAPFPVELPRRAIAATNAKVIFDPFSGSGTTGVAAQLEGRDFIGCELDPGYLESARVRLGIQAAEGTTQAAPAANDNAVVRYATVCSGIEGVTAAWEPLGGFRPVFFSEIEAFPSAVLAHHFPNVTNLGDLTKIDGYSYRGAVDVFWGSTPCQSLSVAGKREGLSDPRGQLTLKFVELADTINPTFIAWENVKNVLSVQEGSAFGQFLGALAGSGRELRPPAGSKWGHAGYVVGPRRIVAWRLFDAQFAGLAQRRERLFAVASPRTSGHDPRDILFEREGESRNCPPCHPQGQGQDDAAAAVGGVVYVNADSRPKFSLTTAHTLKAANGNGGRACVAFRDANGTARVRELLPIEWERLQGFRDGWTDIGRAPKTLRQKALGNSLAVPDVRWIGERIKASVEGKLACHRWPDLPSGGGGRQQPFDWHERDFRQKYRQPRWKWAA